MIQLIPVDGATLQISLRRTVNLLNHFWSVVISFFLNSGSAWPITLGVGVGLGAGYSNCRHQFLWHGPHRPPFGRPPWGGGRPLWSRFGKDGEAKHQDRKVRMFIDGKTCEMTTKSKNLHEKNNVQKNPVWYKCKLHLILYCSSCTKNYEHAFTLMVLLSVPSRIKCWFV